MVFILSLLGGFIGIVLAVMLIIFVVIKKIKGTVGDENFGELKDVFQNNINLRREEYSRPKSVMGITDLIEPTILRDFSDFNKNLLYSKAEEKLRKIINSINNKSIAEIEHDNEFIYLENRLREYINDLNENNIEESFSDVIFNRHAISNYIKKDGMATIRINTTLSYYYKTNKKKVKNYSDIKKETRYTTEFVYVYDEARFEHKPMEFSIHCPNCGAPLKSLDYSSCKYCGSHIEKINLKAWKMISYKEDYK